MLRFSSLVLLLAVPLAARADGDPNAINFEKHVLPILKESCYRCHDAKKGTADFRIDVRASAKRGGESKKVGIVPGKAGESELYRRIASADEDLVMPPKKPLAKAKVEIIKKWIDAGAVWPDSLSNEEKGTHWAFVAPVRPPVPEIQKAKGKGKNEIDAFILARLEKDGLNPSPAADATTLVRRLYLDLIGLPPTPAEVDDFLKDTSPTAYAKLVDKLLASPHYGEKWGRLWLDAARYADSDGYEKDKPRFVHFYRDYVINAFNRDLPYNQFLTEQLAGDLLPNRTQDQIVATGFLRNSMINEEGGIDPEQFRMEAMFDRMDAVGKGMLGLTIQCAQCHTHKYDPITHADYYRLFAYLNNSHEANVTVYTPDELMKRADIFQKVKAIEADLKHKTPDWPMKLAAWQAGVRKAQPSWDVVRPTLDTSGGQKHTLLADGSISASGYAPTKHTTDFSGPTKLKTIAAARLELLNDPNLPRGGPGRSIFGLFALTEFKLEINGKPVKIASATADANGTKKALDAIFDDKSKRTRVTGSIAFAIDGDDTTAWSPDVGGGRSNGPRNAVFVFDKPIEVPANASITFKLTQNHGGWNSDDNQNNNLGRFRLSVSETAAVADPLYGNADAFAAYRTTVKAWDDANGKIEDLWKEHPVGTSQLVYTERTEERPTHLLKRGDFLKPGEQLTVGTPEFLNAAAGDLPPNRIGLAKWMTDAKAPTTARAFVNRVWQAYFGTGIVATSEDFGKQSDPPSHPELLDWLAVEFMEKGWGIKQLHKLIVTSATYQQSSKVTAELTAKDPANRLLARGPRFRVDGEIVRDIALSASGLLNPKVGGPSVYPPIPLFLTQPPASYGPKVWPESTGADRYRRSLYVFRFRSIPYPALQAFDAPTGDFACVKRSRSNTPLQALTAMNEPIFVEAAQALGLRILKDGGATDGERIAFAFRLCTARKPAEPEAKILTELLRKNVAKYSAATADPWAVAIANPEDAKQLPNAATPADLAAWVTVARVLLNLDETMTKE